MLPGDVIFEGGDDWLSRVIARAQATFCRGKGDPQASHAAIMIAPFLIMEADPKQNIHFRVVEEADFGGMKYIYRPKSAVSAESMHSAPSVFLGELYSYSGILWSRLRATDEVASTLGSAFCSSLVKRILQTAGLGNGLNKELLVSPCELQAELASSDHWTELSVEEYRRIWDYAEVRDLARASAGALAHGFNLQVTTSLQTAMMGYLAATLTLEHAETAYPFDALPSASRLLALSGLQKAAEQRHWAVQRASTSFSQIKDALNNGIINNCIALQPYDEQQEPIYSPLSKSISDLCECYNAIFTLGDRDDVGTWCGLMADVLDTCNKLPLEEAIRIYSQAKEVSTLIPLDSPLNGPLVDYLVAVFEHRQAELEHMMVLRDNAAVLSRSCSLISGTPSQQ